MSEKTPVEEPPAGDKGSSTAILERPPKSDEKDEARCPKAPEAFSQILVLPESPSAEQPVRVLAVTRDTSSPMTLILSAENGTAIAPDRDEAWGERPRAYSLYFPRLEDGQYRATLLDDDAGPAACLDFEVTDNGGKPKRAPAKHPAGGVWPVKHSWSAAWEDVYSAFVTKLFYVEPGSRKGWKPLHQAARDPFRNILYGILGRDEDNPKAPRSVKLEPDCGDTPYQIRAYFSWKMGLPFMFHHCTRGTSVKGAACNTTYSNLTQKLDHISNPVERFNTFAASYIGWKVHSGNGRTLPESDQTDFYPIPLDVESIRPGSVFVDAGGHVILVSQIEPQTRSAMGALYGVDSHPDRTVTHKQFDIGTFVFNHRVPTDGFKAFRPVVYKNGRLRFLTNSEINERPGLVRYANDQASIESTEAFYQEVNSVLNPTPVDPKTVLLSKIDVLLRAMQERAEAVQLGVEYMIQTGWKQMSMPDGPAIFQTTGPWETYSTPARDMRCFLAIDDVLTFPDQVLDNPSLYAVRRGTDLKALKHELIALRDSGLRERTIQYTRSDGSTWTLTLADVVARRRALEMAYNPNDCPEIRWAAPKNSEEIRACNQNAPADQRFKMRLARPWFETRRRPDQR